MRVGVRPNGPTKAAQCVQLRRRLSTACKSAGNASQPAAKKLSRKARQQQEQQVTVDSAGVTDVYFQGYSRIEIHEAMLRDKPRTEAYRRAIVKNPALFEGKTVLDVGCGTGVLSLFAAKAGAEHVYGIDASLMAFRAQQIVRDNGFRDQVTILHGKVEEIELPVDKVDIIISEWMGYFLLYESMLDSVLWARDRWLAPDGVLLPDSATLYLVGVQDPDNRNRKLEFWQDVYGLNMRAMKPLVLSTAHLATVKPDVLATTSSRLTHLDISNALVADTEFTAPFELTALHDCSLTAVAAYFDVEFAAGSRGVTLSTSPKADRTHWQQTVLCLPEEVDMLRGEVLQGEVVCRKNQLQSRWLDICLRFTFKGARGKRVVEQMYYLH